MHTPLFTCLNGVLLPAAEALLPVADRGFRFGDGVFETISVHHGVPYQWEAHMARLATGLEVLRVSLPAVDWQAHARALLHQHQAVEGTLRLSVSRGVGSRGYLPEDATPNWVIEYLPVRPLPTAPAQLWLSQTARTPLPGNHKLAQGLSSVLALMEAQDHGCEEALQLTPNRLVSCAASANLFWIKGKALFTPSLATHCLAGTTRAAILRLSPLPVHACEAELEVLSSADAVFLSNSRYGVWPVAALAPAGLTFAADHPLIAQLAQLLVADRDAYSQTHHALWSHA